LILRFLTELESTIHASVREASSGRRAILCSKVEDWG
jgi:hypothetical protein